MSKINNIVINKKGLMKNVVLKKGGGGIVLVRQRNFEKELFLNLDEYFRKLYGVFMSCMKVFLKQKKNVWRKDREGKKVKELGRGMMMG